MQGYHTVGEQVVPWTDVPLETRGWITYAPVNKIERWVVTSRDPGWPATGSPRIVFPRVVTEFARTGNRVEPPFLTASFRIIGRHETANPILATRDANNY